MCQKLLEEDHVQRSQFAQNMLDLYENNENLILLMSDEVHFHLNGFVNKQFRYWCSNNTEILNERPLHVRR